GVSGGRGRGGTGGGEGIPLDEGLALFGNIVGRDDSEDVPIETIDERTFRLAQPDRVLGQGLENRLQIEGRASDHLEQLAGGRLLLERDAEFAVTGLQLREQPHVLDGNDRLIGEGLEKGNLSVTE